MPVFEAIVLVAPLTNDFDELCLLALLHRTSVLGFALGFFPAVPVEVGGDTGVRRSTLGSGNRSVTQGTHRNLFVQRRNEISIKKNQVSRNSNGL